MIDDADDDNALTMKMLMMMLMMMLMLMMQTWAQHGLNMGPKLSSNEPFFQTEAKVARRLQHPPLEGISTCVRTGEVP